ncbi:PKD domain-containing protein [Niastella sp. OAS944]|uniref:PKD domain-containing protein n=1 Tax=Niastella sp. OAS944 TaxID=2664089 RepID=UPI003483112F|nr:gliding motility-associated-like protein [Chitinophagaceae bacterium OAS944]
MKINLKHTYRGYIQEQLSGCIVLVVFILTSLCSRAQNVSNRGTEFWVGYGHHQFMEQLTNDMNMVLYLSAEDQPATVTVTIDSSGLVPATWWRKTYTIPAYTVISSDIIPKGVVNVPAAAGDPFSDPNYDARLFTDPPPAGTGGAGIFRKKGIHIQSNVPIVAYAHIYGSMSSGATMLLPVTAWGYSYVSLNSRQSYASDCYNWMYVIASKDNTVIQVTPKVVTRAQNLTGLRPSQTSTITLMKGQIYQVIGANDGADANGNGGNSGTGKDLSGTIVRSMANGANDCYPIAVFAGSSRTANPASCGSGGGDNDNQQLFPQHAWGKKYLTAPFSGSATANSFARSTYKVAVRDPATVVTVNGAPIPSPLLAGNFYIYESSTADLIEADKPIEVMQFMTGGGCLPGLGDPEMVVLSPIEQATKSVGFFRNNKESISVNYCTLIVPTLGLTSLKFCGNPMPTHSYAHPNMPGYSVVIKRWDSPLPPAAPLGQCLVTCDSAFTGITYGLGNVESYAYNIGTYLNNLNAVGSVHNEPDTTNGGKNSHKFTCVNTPVKLSALIRYQPLKLVWNISSLGAVVTPNTDVTLDPASAAFDGTETVNGITYYKYTLPGTYNFNTPGTYTIPIRSTSLSLDNCNNTEELKITVEVKPRPTADFTFSHPTGCVKDTVLFTGPASTGSYTIGQWKWTFADGSKDSVQNPHKALAAPGAQNINLAVVTGDGCMADVTKSITVYAPPVTTLNAAPAAICEGGSITFNETSSYGGPVPLNSWYWDLGNNTVINATNNSQQSATYTTYGTYTAKHVVKVSALCVSDTAQVPVTVYANPIAGFSYPAGCLPDNGIVQFTDTTKVPDGQTLSSWGWTFGDPNATPANPNTSTQQNPTHTYSFGNYTIQFSVTTSNGCTKNITVPATFSLRPKLVYASLPAVCGNINSSVNVAFASVTNGVPGTGIYSGPGTTAAGGFTPSAAGAGTHTITYTFTTTAGCTESITSSITVYPKPTASFTATPDICLGESATITDQSTITSGSITSWRWNFGDAAWTALNNANAFPHTWPTYNTYSVKLVAVSDQGCTSDTATRIVTVHPLPVTAFSLPAAVCMPGGLAEFKNASTVADQSALSYTWNFGDNSTVSHVKDAGHTYAASGSYTVKLDAVSSFGCAGSVSKQLSSFFDKPVAAFTVTPDTLCQGSDNEFHDESTNSNGTITQWNWSFGDGSVSTEHNPTKRYQQPGNYTVQLKVTNNANCTSQPVTKQVVVYLQPVIDAGTSFTVPQGTVVQFNPTANDSTSLSFIWSPATGLSNANKLRPLLQAMIDETYTLTATGEGQCTAADFLKVKILKPVNVPNAFTPNGDGVHDTWNITNLSDYPGCTVAVFNRYGQRVYYSSGYGTPWDGTVGGKPLPMATYYYVIHLKNGFAPLSGSITIIR